MDTESLSPDPSLVIGKGDSLLDIARKYQFLLSGAKGAPSGGHGDYTEAMDKGLRKCKAEGDPEQVLAIRKYTLPDLIRGNLDSSLNASLESAGKKGYLRTILRVRESEAFPDSSEDAALAALRCALGVCAQEAQVETLLATRKRIPPAMREEADSALYSSMVNAAKKGYTEPLAKVCEEDILSLPEAVRQDRGKLMVRAIRNAAKAGSVVGLSQLLSYNLPPEASDALPRALIRSMRVHASRDKWLAPIKDLRGRNNLPPEVKRAADELISSGKLSEEAPSREIRMRDDGTSISSSPPRGLKGLWYRVKPPKPDSRNPHKMKLINKK
jgi:hypothetical protein